MTTLEKMIADAILNNRRDLLVKIRDKIERGLRDE